MTNVKQNGQKMLRRLGWQLGTAARTWADPTRSAGDDGGCKLTVPSAGTNVPVQSMVREFHRLFGLPASDHPTHEVPEALIELRRRLQEEETEELAEALEARDLVGIADALADIIYVAYGTAATFGLDLDAVVSEVHRSNLSKLGEDGRPVMRADGKVLKSPSYSPPDVVGALGIRGFANTSVLTRAAG